MTSPAPSATPDTGALPSLSALIVSYNVRSYVLETLRSYYLTCGESAAAILVDNASTDGTADAIHEAYPQTHIIRLPENVGFGRANNAGLEAAHTDFVLLLNPDVVLGGSCVARLSEFLIAHPDAGAAGPRLERPDGRLDLAARRAFPSPMAALFRFAGLSRLFPNSPRFNRYNLGHLSIDTVHEIDAGTAACLMVRRSALDKVGMFDPDYFMYGEDLDLCYRLRKGGWKIFFVPNARAIHVKGTSTRQARDVGLPHQALRRLPTRPRQWTHLAWDLVSLGDPQPSRPDHKQFDSVALIETHNLRPPLIIQQPAAAAPTSPRQLPRAMFIGILLLALVKGLVWSVVLPPWYGPDEASHYAYVQELVEDHWLPRGSDPNAGMYYPREILCSEINLGIGTASDVFSAEPPFGAPWTSCTASSPADRHATNPSNAAGYSPVYYAAAIPMYLLVQPLRVESRLAAVRLWSVILGVLAAAFAYLAARWALPHSSSLSAAAAVLFVLQPMNSQQTASVNNDALLIAVAAAFWWRFYRSLRNGFSTREALVMGSLIGLAYLAKPQGIFLAATMPIVYLISHEPGRLRTDMNRVAKLIAVSASPVIAGVAIGALFSTLAGNSSPLTPAPGGYHGVTQYLAAYADGHFERVYLLFNTSFWGFFGWFQVDLPSYVYVLIALTVVAGVIGALTITFTPSSPRRVVIASLLAVMIPIALFMLLELYSYRVTHVLVLQGRAFLMLLFPLSIVLILGWRRLLPRVASSWLSAAIVLAATLLNLASLAVMIEAFYG
jgi:N-acetylglucosaminyl-diphospho-decaprenol L-rhamnosyltransferase